MGAGGTWRGGWERVWVRRFSFVSPAGQAGLAPSSAARIGGRDRWVDPPPPWWWRRRRAGGGGGLGNGGALRGTVPRPLLLSCRGPAPGKGGRGIGCCEWRRACWERTGGRGAQPRHGGLASPVRACGPLAGARRARPVWHRRGRFECAGGSGPSQKTARNRRGSPAAARARRLPSRVHWPPASPGTAGSSGSGPAGVRKRGGGG